LQHNQAILLPAHDDVTPGRLLLDIPLRQALNQPALGDSLTKPEAWEAFLGCHGAQAATERLSREGLSSSSIYSAASRSSQFVHFLELLTWYRANSYPSGEDGADEWKSLIYLT